MRLAALNHAYVSQSTIQKLELCFIVAFGLGMIRAVCLP
jgi:hypothetical protein